MIKSGWVKLKHLMVVANFWFLVKQYFGAGIKYHAITRFMTIFSKDVFKFL